MEDETTPEKTLDFFINHLFLPPKLPGSNDSSPEKNFALIDLVQHSLDRFQHEAGFYCQTAIVAASSLTKNLRSTKDEDGLLYETGVLEVFENVSSSAEDVAAFQITDQNAAVLLRKMDEHVLFEFFELSPSNSAALAPPGRLVRRFPATAIRVSLIIFERPDFQSVLAKTLVNMSNQAVSEVKHKVSKAEQMHDEDRDTNDPHLVTELLMSFLRGVGEATRIDPLCKNTREEVIWKDSSLPWSRSGLWLLIRVSLQLTMQRTTGDSADVYKPFMAFLLARVLNIAVAQGRPSDLLGMMTAKICRRLKKLHDPRDGKWLKSIDSAVSEASLRMSKRWDGIQHCSEPQLDMTALASLETKTDDLIPLGLMDRFIASISQRDNQEGLSFCPTPGIFPLNADKLPPISAHSNHSYMSFHLAAVESWIVKDLKAWVKRSGVHNESLYRDIYDLMREYHKAASSCYHSPESISRMLLVILELWVAADEAAVQAIPLLRDYDPEIPLQVYQALLLGFKDDMERLHRAESHVNNREDFARGKNKPSIFSSFGHKTSFQVSYAKKSAQHQDLLRRILDDAAETRRQKEKEFQRVRQTYDNLMSEYNSISCQEVEKEEDGLLYTEHDPSCKRCRLHKQARKLSIIIHEWPLSNDNNEALSTVFELAVPPVFGQWRDATLYLLVDVLQCQKSKSKPQTTYSLWYKEGTLHKHAPPEQKWRVHLLSDTKPHIVTHRKAKPIGSSSLSQICLNNGLRLQYVDGSFGVLLEEIVPTPDLSTKCTFQLPARSAGLQRFLQRTYLKPEGETPNQAIASQSQCPTHMTLSEYKALVEMPFGYRTQWMSVLRQLAMPEVDINKTETAMFLLQISLQAGPNSSGEIARCSHSRLCDELFGKKMHEHLLATVQRMSENWESYIALWVCTFLAGRLLSMVEKSLRSPFLEILHRSRTISRQWLATMRQRADQITDEKQREEFQSSMLDIHLIQAETFNVDDELLTQILSDPQQSFILVEASINIYNNANLLRDSRQTLQGIMHVRWKHTLHRALPIFVKAIKKGWGDESLNLAIKRCWPAFTPEVKWRLVPSTYHWFETTSSQLKVHLDLLTGQLLVDGRPLSRLPRGYEAHDDYQRLFGSSVLDVMPSPLPGLHFCSITTFEDYKVHFGMQNTSGSATGNDDLLVRLEKDGTSLELIPPRVFSGVLPNCFVDEFVHWYHYDSKTVELRPLDEPWTHRDNNWILSSHNSSWRLTRSQDVSLIYPWSRSARKISQILSPLESILDLFMYFDRKAKTLSMELPRLQLGFQLREGESAITSRQFLGMQIDADQSIGTLIGFKSKLILRDSNDAQSRKVIIPRGTVQHHGQQYECHGRHVNASVTYGTAKRVEVYQIDNLLHQLKDNGKVESKLFLAYLHALTSHCVPDMFTGLTGTEKALEILQSASVRSISCLSEAALETLQQIASLTPGRSYYPEYVKVMQTIKWSPQLSFAAQDSRFYKAVQQILDRTSTIKFLHPSNEMTPFRLNHAKMHLVEREIIRNAGRCVSGFGAEDFNKKSDHFYDARDGVKQAKRTNRVRDIVYRVDCGLEFLPVPVSQKLVDHLYGLLSSEKVKGSMPLDRKLGYDSKWLQDPTTFLSSLWCPLQFALLHDRSSLGKYDTMIWLATLSYAENYDAQLTQALMMLFLSNWVSLIAIPPGTGFDLAQGYTDSVVKAGLLYPSHMATITFDRCPQRFYPALPGETAKQTNARRRREHERNGNQAANDFRDQVFQQWPCAIPHQPQCDSSVRTYIDVRRAIENIAPKWRVWHNNLLFRNHLQSFVDRLCKVPVKPFLAPNVFEPARSSPISRQGFESIEDAFANPPAVIASSSSQLGRFVKTQPQTLEDPREKLSQLISSLSLDFSSTYEKQYLRELKDSISSLDRFKITRFDKDEDALHERTMSLQENLELCEGRVMELYHSLSDTIKSSPSSDGASRTIRAILVKAGCFPRVCPILFLKNLRHASFNRLSSSWRDAIIAYGVAITLTQQARRLVKLQDNEGDLDRELENTGRQGWDPHKYPEWLLLECESELMIRQVQTQIAQQMIEPPDNRNAVMQLNMGEGKSSVIIPIVSVALSNGSQLVRVVVAKPQAKQMYQILVSKLAGLLDRPVYQMPFSRAIRMDAEKAKAVRDLAERCISEGGVMMVQPEHLLSFQLMGLECQNDREDELASHLLDTLRFFDNSARDLVDESDENFSVKFELVYTIGLQQPIDYSPDRWAIIQEALRLVAEFSILAKDEFPHSIDLDNQHVGRFPRVRILRVDAQDAIFSRVAASICSTGLSGFPIARQPRNVREAVQKYITKLLLSSEEIRAVEKSNFWDDTTMKTVLLLRGLFACGILAFALGQKRWRVNYGIDDTRERKTRLAVPFRAKDSPTPRSEFSHPDVVIVLTCLSYYYGGLQEEDLFSILEQLVRSDNPEVEYQDWVKTAPDMPQAYRQLKGVNLRDRTHCELQVFPHLRYSKGAIDYFLSKMVFAKESREFPHKLSVSGWDLGKVKTNPMTGFSGTNDSRYVLPLDVTQLELPEQNHTNALVLEHLLRPENSIELVPQQGGRSAFDSETLLAMMAQMTENTRVVLDVGAQIIDLSNREFAEQWLHQHMDDDSTQAVVFFSDFDELLVLDKSGYVEELQVSPFATQLNQCLVFLDEAHTRGTDLKLPANYRAAVTLGANSTKDRLVQACMRMRKLGKGQSVVFCVPWEVEHKILEQQGRQPPLTVSDVLCWAIGETLLDLRRTIPLWLTQGSRFYIQKAHWDAYPRDAVFSQSRVQWAKAFRETEAQTLNDHYQPGKAHRSLDSLIQPVEEKTRELLRKRCEDFGLVQLQRAAALQEEQERELSPEVERTQQVELPPPVMAATHAVVPDVRKFVLKGRIPERPVGMKPAFQALGGTSAAEYLDVTEFPCLVWVTNDFSKTIEITQENDSHSDSFQRGVQWVLTSTTQDGAVQLLLISSYEAQELLPTIEKSDSVTLHVYSPRKSLEMPSLDQLTLYTVPQRTDKLVIPKEIITQLNLFAGQLYLSSWRDYISICDSLGLAWTVFPDDSVELGPDGFIPRASKDGGTLINKSGFTKSPVKFLKAFMTSIRQNCESIERTHMGKILDGVLLKRDDFEELGEGEE
ncbi:hypothetical protein CP533_4405 [Ophiocordyceps camponoti-saundersi (nom. inval.)]|nr:hypothetical protein CP533_4405 [Ophiocordyceps camponoti-saundersi (nom. inval.)]